MLGVLAAGPARITDIAQELSIRTGEASRHVAPLGEAVERTPDGRETLTDPAFAAWLLRFGQPTRLVLSRPDPAGYNTSMPAGLITTRPEVAKGSWIPALPREPSWGLHIEGKRVSLVLRGGELPRGALLRQLVILLPHVTLPFDFREGISRFRHHRGNAELLEIAVESRVLLDWLHNQSGGQLSGRARDDALVLQGVTETGARYTMRARLLPDPEGPRDGEDEPSLVLSLYDFRVFGVVEEPWPLLATRVLDLLPAALVCERTLTTARLRVARPALAWVLSGLGWKLPDLARLMPEGVELREGWLVARFRSAPDEADGPAAGMVTLDAVPDGDVRGAFERFIEDLELKRHHGQIDRLLAAGEAREAIAEIYRALDGAPQPGFLAERLVGISAARPILYDEGERVCRELLRADPGYAPALCGLASIAMGRGRIEEAAVYLERLGTALGSGADREDATAADITLAEVLRETDPTEAKYALERVLTRSPDHEEALEALIALAEEEGDEAAALPLYKRLLFAARSTERTRGAGIRLARHALARKQPEEARVFLRVVLEAAPADLDAQIALAQVERQAGENDKAVRILEAALRAVPPNDTQALVKVASHLARLSLGPLGDPRRARRVLWRAVDAVGLTDAAALELGRLAIDAHEPELAKRLSDRVPLTSDLWSEAACVRARACIAAGEERPAREQLLEVLVREPAHAEALELLELCAGRDSEARQQLLHPLRDAAERASVPLDRARVNRSLARLYESLGLDWDAIGPYQRVLEQAFHDPLAEEVAERLLALYARFGMWPEHQELGRQMADEATEPSLRAALLIRLGKAALEQLGDPQAALKPLQEAVHLAPRDTEALTLLRDSLDALGEGEALLPVLRRLSSVHSEERERAEALLRLAELQLEVLDAPLQARATLAQLPQSRRRTERYLALARRLEPGAAKPPASPQPEPESPPATTSPPEPPEHAPAYQRALRLADEGQLRAALELLEGLLEQQPLHVPAMELARVLADELGDPTRSLELGEALVELTVSRPARVALLEELLELAQERAPERAEQHAELLLRLSPLNERAADFLREKSLQELEQAPSPEPLPDDARERVEEGDQLEKLVARAEAALRADDFDGARAAVEEALSVDPDCVGALEVAAAAARGEEDWERLVELLERLAELAFDAPRALAFTLERGEVLADRVGDMAAAAEAWRRYADWQPLDDRIFERLETWYLQQELAQELAELYEQRAAAALEATQDAADPRPLLRAYTVACLAEARVRLWQLDDPEAALTVLEPARERLGDDPELLECSVRALAAARRWDECRSELERLLPEVLPGPLRDELLELAEQLPPGPTPKG